MKQSDQLVLIMAQACAEPIGLLVATNDFARARQAFYRARAEAGVEEFNQLQFRASPGLEGGDLIIIKQKVEVRQLPAPEPSAQSEQL